MVRTLKKKVVPKKQVSALPPRKARSRPIWALVFFTIAVFSLVAIGDFDLNQSSYRSTEAVPEDNLVGLFGAKLGYWGFHSLGVAVWFVPVFLFWICVRLAIQQASGKRFATCCMSFVSVVCVAGLFAMMENLGVAKAGESIFESQLGEFGFGGVIGQTLTTSVLEKYIGDFGTILILSIGFIIGLIFVFTDSLEHFLDWVRMQFRRFLVYRARSKEEAKKLRAKKAAAKRLAKIEVQRAKEAEKIAAKKEKESRKVESKEFPEKENVPDDEDPRPSLLNGPMDLLPGLEGRQDSENALGKKRKPNMEKPEPSVDNSEFEVKKPKPDPEMIRIISREKTEKAVAMIPERRGDYKFPPIELLVQAPDVSNDSPEDHAATMEALVRTLDEFGVNVIPEEIHTGPVITRYEVKPASGVRVEKIVNLDKNIALGLKAMSVRILAPVPGKGTVGIEVPNKMAQAVCMRDIVESKAWGEAKAEIPIVLGKDVTGKPMVADLTKMPHVLIAGSTGSGKTVCINAIIASLLYHSGPEDLRFIMVDPKVVEMQIYNELPHMLIPVVSEPKKVPGALKWLIAEMERRYQIFATENVRNIAGFNAKIAKTREEKEKATAMDAEMTAEERAAVSQIKVPRDEDAFEVPKKRLPYIVCIIDELADLMMVAPADIETGIARLAQLARAAGIHLILATQRPSVNVITGVIKANLPSRISFKVASKVDSRTILDGSGAESLIGKGDMLFIPPGTSTLVRAQGAFVSDDEINGIVDYLKQNNEAPVFAESVQQQIDAGGEEERGFGGSDEGSDELLPEALDVLRSTKRASTSMLQRRLRVGYNRAARLMETLEEKGIVGPENGSSPREILVDLDAM